MKQAVNNLWPMFWCKHLKPHLLWHFVPIFSFIYEMMKSIFRPAFAVRSTQTLVEIYNIEGKFCVQFSWQPIHKKQGQKWFKYSKRKQQNLEPIKLASFVKHIGNLVIIKTVELFPSKNFWKNEPRFINWVSHVYQLS